MEHLMDVEGKSRVSARDEPPFVRLSFLTSSPFNVGHSDIDLRVENVTVDEFWLNVDAVVQSGATGGGFSAQW